MPQPHSKDALRAAARQARSSLPARRWVADDAARTAALLAWLDIEPATLACYTSRADEPGTKELILELARRGWRILLPKLSRQPQWAEYTSWAELRPGWAGILEPTAVGLGPAALAQAQVILTACLAVSRDGVRLGMGGGWYDRALLHRARQAQVVALARAVEVHEYLPSEPHDVPVGWCATELGVLQLGENRHLIR